MSYNITAPFFNDSVPLSEHVTAGKDAKDLLILAHGELSFPDVENALLMNILKSVKYDMNNEIHLVYNNKALYDVVNYCSNHAITRIISFGKKPSDIGFKIKEVPYHLFTIGNLYFIYADSLDKINNSKDLKNKLWSSMKEMFHE